MTIEEITSLDLHGKDILIIGRPSAGKTWLSKVLGGMLKYHTVVHTDSYLKKHPHEAGQIEAIIEDTRYLNETIVEGMLGYLLLLEGARRKCYEPDYIITVDISAGKQREIYLKERDPAKLKYLKKFEYEHLNIMNEYHRLVPVEQKPIFISFLTEWNYASEVKD